jgi:hypothetical protein
MKISAATAHFTAKIVTIRAVLVGNVLVGTIRYEEEKA